jgi:organic hydroperoxide reductase OsmC/OhrA
VERRHEYATRVRWTGNRGSGTASYRGYEREHEIRSETRPPIPASSDPAFRGDAARWNPELLFVASLSECHMLQYLHLCAQLGIVVTDYEDDAVGTLLQTEDGGGAFLEVVLAPVVTITDAEHISRATGLLHQDAHRLCFIANSVRTPVRHRPTVQLGT